MDNLNQILESLLTSAGQGLNSRLEEIAFDIEIEDTNSKGYCYALKVDANGNLRFQDLIEFIAFKIIDYAIPRKERIIAGEHYNRTGSTLKLLELRKKASGLFTNLKKTGEGGEILLYALVEEYLKFPQIICKMPLKTSTQVHYQGADGIHVSYNDSKQELNLYWGEAKMYKDINSAISACLGSLKDYLLNYQGYKSAQERDLQLITSNIGNCINNPDLESLLVRYFDKDDDLSNKVVYKGVCFIGFDFDQYPPITKSTQDIKAAIEVEINDWLTRLKDQAYNLNLEHKEIHIFLIPFPSVEEFRSKFIMEVK